MTIKHYPWLENTLKKYEQRNFASSIIIEGESGLAKSELASYFAKRLLCSQIDAPCDNCNSCNYYEASSHPDFCFLSSDSCSSSLYSISKAKKDSIVSKKIEGVRALNEYIGMSNSVSQRRVAVIYDAHLMNVNAQNALLKTLEELPANKHIFIVSNKRNYFLPTIYSRSSIISINNPNADTLNQWIIDQGYIDYSVLNFAPDSTPLEIKRLINDDLANQYLEITQTLNSFCLGKVSNSDLIKFFKDISINYDEKINAIILFLKICLAISTDFYKPHPVITVYAEKKVESRIVSDLIEDLLDYKMQLIKVPALNEQIGLNHFLFKIKNIF